MCIGNNDAGEPLFAGLGLAETVEQAQRGFTLAEVELALVDDFNRLPPFRILQTQLFKMNLPISEETTGKLKQICAKDEPLPAKEMDENINDFNEIKERAAQLGLEFTTEELEKIRTLLGRIPARVAREPSQCVGFNLEVDRLDRDKINKAKRQSSQQTRHIIQATL